jgi:beta-glucanase (GH16 family)
MKKRLIHLLLIGFALIKAAAGIAQDAIFDDFNDSTLSSTIWEFADRSWSAGNPDNPSHGGVIPELINISDGVLSLRGDGNLYTGNIMGIGRKTKVGSCIISKTKHASGRYEVRAKIMPQAGVLSAFWTFDFHGYSSVDSGNINHEIDIEIKKNGTAFDQALCNTWIYEKVSTQIINNTFYNQDDGKYHIYRFDWHTGGNGIQPRVEFYYDDVLKETITTNIPSRLSQFWIGNWFPSWAGTPDFDIDTMFVDWVKIIPFHEANDEVSFLGLPQSKASEKYAMIVYPNPIKRGSSLNISVNDENAKDGILEIYNLMGEKIITEKISFPGNKKTHLDISIFEEPGVYLLRFSINKKIFWTKLSVFE